jgi:hypothetical protein
MIGFWTHWVDDRHHPCTTLDGNCPGCALGQKPRWYGYINVLTLPARRRRILIVTAGAAQYSPSLKKHDGQLRGLGVRITRLYDAKNAPMKLELGECRTRVELPEDWDLIKALYLLWGVNPGVRPPDQVELSPRPAKAKKSRRKSTKGEAEHGG